MVEFAILAIVLTLLVAGGIELATAAFSAQRVSDGSRAAVDEWVYAMGSAGVYAPDGVDWEIRSSPLAGGRVGLGNHGGAFRRPSCDPGDATVYDDGLPEDSVANIEGPRTAVYLFNPLPIDVTACLGPDGTDSRRTRLSVLVDRLPALNRAIYSLYQRRCGDADGNEIFCTDTANAVTTYLRLPGKLDLPDDTVSLAMLDGDPASPTFQMPLVIQPVFEIQCADPAENMFTTCDWADEPDGRCWRAGDGAPSPLACDIRVRVRYRYIFHALLQYPFVFWNDPLPAEALEQMDLGPTGSPPGVVGSEVARGNVRRLQRTFLGCWETVTTAPGAGMQGRRSTRACN